MNFTELARRLKLTPAELHEVLPLMGFDIGRRAIKVDKRIAERIIEMWVNYKHTHEREKREKQEVELQRLRDERSQVKIRIPSVITVREFAERLKLPVTTILSELLKNGIMLAMNERLDYETAIIVAQDLGFQVEEESIDGGETEKEEKKMEDIFHKKGEKEGELKERPPVVVVMGHVDHGKTKLLDTIRKTHVLEGESGGITQHIGAYQTLWKNHLFTFIDTPGHEAFTTMRSRGARVADIAVLVVAADDGVKPQTREALKIIRAANLPMIVAINKIDKPEANIEKVKTELSHENIIPEEWGGNTIMISLSAKDGTGIDELLDTIQLVADLHKEKFQSNPNLPAVGTVIESHLDKGEGPVATVLIQLGTLRLNDYLGVDNIFYGKVRAMRNYKGDSLEEATLGTPVKILGFKIPPAVGDILEATTDSKKLERGVKPYQAEKTQLASTIIQGEVDGKSQNLNILLKADVLGSLEAIILSLEKLSHPEVPIRVVGKGLGVIHEADIIKAEAMGAMIYGFHVKPTTMALALAKEKQVEIFLYKVIYDLIGDVKSKVEARLSPEVFTTELGKIQVLALFRKEKDQTIVGGKVLLGKIEKGVLTRVRRGGEMIGQGEVLELQIGREKMNEVFEGQECGIALRVPFEIALHDVLEIYREELKKKHLATADIGALK